MPNDKSQLMLAEYSALRNELDKRRDIRYRILTFAVLLLGTVTALVLPGTKISGEGLPHALFAYPIAAYLLSILWCHNYRHSIGIATYIAEQIEAKSGYDGWSSRKSRRRNPRTQPANYAACAVFVFAEIASIVLGLIVMLHIGEPWAKSMLSHWLLCGIAVAVTVGTIIGHCWIPHPPPTEPPKSNESSS